MGLSTSRGPRRESPASAIRLILWQVEVPVWVLMEQLRSPASWMKYQFTAGHYPLLRFKGFTRQAARGNVRQFPNRIVFRHLRVWLARGKATATRSMRSVQTTAH